MTPDQVARLRADATLLTAALAPMMLRGLGPSGSLIQASLRALGLDLANLTRDPLAGVPDGAVATLAWLLHRRLADLGAGHGPEPSAADQAAALAILGTPAA